MHPRDPKFKEKARVILDLYQGIWEAKPIGPRDQVLSADEKPSIQTSVGWLPPGPESRDGWKATISHAAPSSTFAFGMSCAASPGAAASQRPASLPSPGWSTR